MKRAIHRLLCVLGFHHCTAYHHFPKWYGGPDVMYWRCVRCLNVKREEWE